MRVPRVRENYAQRLTQGRSQSTHANAHMIGALQHWHLLEKRESRHALDTLLEIATHDGIHGQTREQALVALLSMECYPGLPHAIENLSQLSARDHNFPGLHTTALHTKHALLYMLDKCLKGKGDRALIDRHSSLAEQKLAEHLSRKEWTAARLHVQALQNSRQASHRRSLQLVMQTPGVPEKLRARAERSLAPVMLPDGGGTTTANGDVVKRNDASDGMQRMKQGATPPPTPTGDKDKYKIYERKWAYAEGGNFQEHPRIL